MDITLYSFAQQCTCFLAQGMQHHTKLCLRPLIGAPNLFFDPDLVCILRGVTLTPRSAGRARQGGGVSACAGIQAIVFSNITTFFSNSL